MAPVFSVTKYVLLFGAALLWNYAQKPSNSPASQYLNPGPYAVTEHYVTWNETERRREIPVKLYIPGTSDHTSFPIVLYSHGLGGTRDGGAYLGNHLASHGILSVHLQHPGSDRPSLEKDSKDHAVSHVSRINPPGTWDRAPDITFALNKLTELNMSSGPLEGRIDMNRVGMSGFSFGGFTTLVVAGQKFQGYDGYFSMGDARVKAAIAMSAPPPVQQDALDMAFGEINIPILHMTGTLDPSPIPGTTAEDRRIPFESISKSDQYLLTLKDGDHQVFSGRHIPSPQSHLYPRQQDLIRMASLAFWLHHLKEDSAAGVWLRAGGFKGELSGEGTFEVRKGKR